MHRIPTRKKAMQWKIARCNRFETKAKFKLHFHSAESRQLQKITANNQKYEVRKWIGTMSNTGELRGKYC